MRKKGLIFLNLCLLVLIFPGCIRLLPSTREVTRSTWKSYDEAKKAFDSIVPKRTTTRDLKTLGFDLYSTPNVKSLNYLDIATATQSLKPEELDGGFRECFNAKSDCIAYQIEPKVMNNQRHGNFFLDLFNFRRSTRGTGWSFRALFVVIGDVVVDKLWSGDPHILEEREHTNPLGPFQEAGPVLRVVLP